MVIKYRSQTLGWYLVYLLREARVIINLLISFLLQVPWDKSRMLNWYRCFYVHWIRRKNIWLKNVWDNSCIQFDRVCSWLLWIKRFFPHSKKSPWWNYSCLFKVSEIILCMHSFMSTTSVRLHIRSLTAPGIFVLHG